jgi:hypothetical protein
LVTTTKVIQSSDLRESSSASARRSANSASGVRPAGALHQSDGPVKQRLGPKAPAQIVVQDAQPVQSRRQARVFRGQGFGLLDGFLQNPGRLVEVSEVESALG